MKEKWQIDAHYEHHMEFFGDNWVCAFEEMVEFRKMLRDAHDFVSMHSNEPKAIKWLDKYERIEEAEDENYGN